MTYELNRMELRAQIAELEQRLSVTGGVRPTRSASKAQEEKAKRELWYEKGRLKRRIAELEEKTMEN